MDNPPWDEIITLDQIQQLHAEALAKYKGLPSKPTDGCLEQCLGNAWSAEKYQNEKATQPSLIFIAYLLFYLAKDHCYADGNKRVAWMSAIFALRYYQLDLKATEDDAVQLMESVASGGRKPREIIDWMSARLEVTEE